MKNYDDFLAEAKLLHPKATISMGVEGTWVINIVTDELVDDALPARFDETPAGIAESNYDGGESVLERWGRKNGYWDTPYVEVAEAYNNYYYAAVHVEEGTQKFFKLNNIPPVSEWDDSYSEAQRKEWAVAGLAEQQRLQVEAAQKFPR